MLDILCTAGLIAISTGLYLSFAVGGASGSARAESGSAQTFYDFTVKDIAGDDVDLSKYKGKVCMVVNVASR